MKQKSDNAALEKKNSETLTMKPSARLVSFTMLIVHGDMLDK